MHSTEPLPLITTSTISLIQGKQDLRRRRSHLFAERVAAQLSMRLTRTMILLQPATPSLMNQSCTRYSPCNDSGSSGLLACSNGSPEGSSASRWRTYLTFQRNSMIIRSQEHHAICFITCRKSELLSDAAASQQQQQ